MTDGGAWPYPPRPDLEEAARRITAMQQSGRHDLGREFDEYRVRYWPRSRTLREYQVQDTRCDDCWGWCDYDNRVIHVDVARHASWSDVQATLLHEMAHVVAGKVGHRSPFWEQLESLLTKGAPISVGFPELGEQGQHLSVIPKRFVRCREFFGPAYAEAQARIEAQASGSGYELLDVIETEFYDGAVAGLMWRDIWARYAHDFGLLDLDGRLLDEARPYREAGLRGWRRGRRQARMLAGGAR